MTPNLVKSWSPTTKVSSDRTGARLPLSAEATGQSGSPTLILCLSSILKKWQCSLTRTAYSRIYLKTGYKYWKHATGTTGRLARLAKHNNSLKHKEAMASWIDFQDNQRKQKSVASSLRKQQISNNRHYLKTIVELLVFCASQEIGLRVHREQESVNKGNFLELLLGMILLLKHV